MAFKFTKIIKVGVQCSEGELIFDFRRPEKEDLNRMTAEKLGLKIEDMEKRLNAVDAIRIQFYDQHIEKIYMLTREGKEETVVDESDQPIDPKKVPDDVKSRAVMNAFELNAFYSKNF